jgi:hypothetical protein
MKLLFLQLIIIMWLGMTAFAGSLQDFSITTNEEAKVKQILENYEKGESVLRKNSNEDIQKEEFREFIGYYLLHTNDLASITRSNYCLDKREAKLVC